MKRPSSRWAAFAWHPGAPEGLEAWERRENSVIGALPYAMLAFTAIATVAMKSGEGQSWALDLVLCAVAGAWLAGGHLLRRTWGTHGCTWGARGWAGTVFFAGLVALMGLLVYRDPLAGFFTFTGYFYAMYLPSGWSKAVGVAAIATLTGTSQAGGFPHSGGMVPIWSGIVFVNLTIAGAFTWFGFVSHTQNEKRKALVDELSSANERLETTLAENAGLHQQLLAQAREAGVLDERQRMAREIHDTLAQGLTGIITQLQAADQASEDPVARRRHFDTATRLARDSLTEARRSVDALRPQPLERASLVDALGSVADSWAALHGVAAAFTVTGTPGPASADTEFALLRIAQEALANVAKHAAASRAGLTLSYMDDEVVLDVRDDGRGFDPADPPARSEAEGGFGLVAMRERIEALSGRLQVESEPGKGTAISACVPLRPAPSAPALPAAFAPAGEPADAPAGELAGARR
ncbi:MAG: sensor histidine kinase [Nocardiopsaceae bacterium]|nr:sensor histidine kinase [Nocardiopsaceae bacterium]